MVSAIAGIWLLDDTPCPLLRSRACWPHRTGTIPAWLVLGLITLLDWDRDSCGRPLTLSLTSKGELRMWAGLSLRAMPASITGMSYATS